MATSFMEQDIFADEKDYINATVFTSAQLKWLILNQTKVQEEKNTVAYNPASINADREFQNTHEYLRGQLDILKYIIGISIDNTTAQSDLFLAQQEQQLNDDEGI